MLASGLPPDKRDELDAALAEASPERDLTQLVALGGDIVPDRRQVTE